MHKFEAKVKIKNNIINSLNLIIMVKKLFFSLFAFIGIVLVSCSSTDSPESAAKKYMQLRIDGNYEELVEYVAYDEGTSKEELEKGKAMILALLQAASGMGEQEKIKSFEVGTAEVSEDGNTATVKISYLYEDGKTKDDDLTLKKVDGKWLWTMK